MHPLERIRLKQEQEKKEARAKLIETRKAFKPYVPNIGPVMVKDPKTGETIEKSDYLKRKFGR